MLKTLKWVYDLGVRQERVRIAGHLQMRLSHLHDNRQVVEDMLRENANLKKPNKANAERLKFKLEVENKVSELINELFIDQNGQWVPGNPIMFPDDNHKGEI